MSALSVLELRDSFEEFLEQEESKDLLRFTTAGSVDDGKSTLIGRLLFDSRNVYEDQLESVTKASVGRNAGAIDFSLLTDGLRAEREQGITIDVAYRYFATPKRKFIIADTPGHEQYTRNMVTGASTAELAVVLVDARKGLLPQSRRHAYISSLLGLPHLVVAINKMDLVGYDQHVFNHIETDFRRFLSRFQSIEPYFVPISALAGDNVVTRSLNMKWFHGPSLLEYLERVPVGNRSQRAAFRFPVQRVVRPDQEFRGYAGTIASGHVRPGDRVTVLPSGRSTRVKNTITFDGNLNHAHAGQSVTITLEDDIDISRGDMIAPSDDLPDTATGIEATLVWLNATPAELNKRYRLKHTTTTQWADLKSIDYRVNINNLDREPADTLEMNAIGSVRIEIARPISFDPYPKNRATGSFILIDPATNATVAAGLISGKASAPDRHLHRASATPVTHAERVVRHPHIGAVIQLGGRADLAWRLERLLFDRNCNVFAFETQEAKITKALVEVGAIVILTGSAEQGFSISTAEEDLHTGIEQLPTANTEALHAIESALERLRVLLPAPGWGDSGGI
ncbi:MAG: sulfate adenylyltransferase subunit CysN [Acidobacteriaceae bacterium]|nr:sulfate adenylyltransferase subunit CysN [Acidobacteriaceae bacterium]